MKHDPSNTNCDKVRYDGAPDVLCTCDEDAPAPSTVLGPAMLSQMGSPTGGMTLSPAAGDAYRRLQRAARTLDIAKQQLAAAEPEWRAALDAMHVEMLRT